jgi:hypothetical protein
VVPASSPVAVATTSAGAEVAQRAIVIGFSSGEEKIVASASVSKLTTVSATTNSLTRS